MLSSPVTDAHAQCDVNVQCDINAQCDVNANSMDIGHVLDTIADCSSGVEVDDIPLSEELRSAISNMEDLDDVSSGIRSSQIVPYLAHTIVAGC